MYENSTSLETDQPKQSSPSLRVVISSELYNQQSQTAPSSTQCPWATPHGTLDPYWWEGEWVDLVRKFVPQIPCNCYDGFGGFLLEFKVNEIWLNLTHIPLLNGFLAAFCCCLWPFVTRRVKAVELTLRILTVDEHNYLQHCKFHVPCNSPLVLFYASVQPDTVIRWTVAVLSMRLFCWSHLNISEPRGRRRSEAVSTVLIRHWFTQLHQFSVWSSIRTSGSHNGHEVAEDWASLYRSLMKSWCFQKFFNN